MIFSVAEATHGARLAGLCVVRQAHQDGHSPATVANGVVGVRAPSSVCHRRHAPPHKLARIGLRLTSP
ncbi:MAG: hypothetical protein KA207_08380, partial [Burkholderiaceae bacterium]|nr:hypothetical protein [Burkholderiaceae bacterium]